VFEGRVSEEPWAFWDFMPTATELAGAKPPEGCKTDGLSLVSFLKGGKAPKRETLYWELHEGKRIQTLRLGDWKAVRDGQPMAPIELYDLKTDTAEAKNLAENKPDLVAKAERMMAAAHVEDPNWPLRRPATEGRKRAVPKLERLKPSPALSSSRCWWRSDPSPRRCAGRC
jgi:arylsulfatase A-like enzyme